MKAKLRICASCEWVFSGGVECPKCQWGSYGAHYVYGNKAYRYAISQKPWMDKKMDDFAVELLKEIDASVPKRSARLIKAVLWPVGE